MTAVHPAITNQRRLMDLRFSGRQIALIVRGKTSPDHRPSTLNQHADCILSTGGPVGYFGDDKPYSGGSASGSWMSLGMNLQGFVAHHEDFTQFRRQYVDLQSARSANAVSTLLFVDVTPAQARRFDDFWSSLTKNPGSFHFLGSNCSNYATKAFRAAGVLTRNVPGLTTPDNLYRLLQHECPEKCRAAWGFIGFRRFGSTFQFILDGYLLQRPN